MTFDLFVCKLHATLATSTSIVGLVDFAGQQFPTFSFCRFYTHISKSACTVDHRGVDTSILRLCQFCGLSLVQSFIHGRLPNRDCKVYVTQRSRNCYRDQLLTQFLRPASSALRDNLLTSHCALGRLSIRRVFNAICEGKCFCSLPLRPIIS